MTECMSDEAVGQFCAATAVHEINPGRYRAEVDEQWTVVGKPNGGYLLAILARAVAQLSPDLHPVAVSSQFLRSPQPGSVLVEAEVLRSGRATSQFRARMSQDDGVCVEALITAGSLDHAAGTYWDAGLPAGSWVDREGLERFVPPAADGFRVAMLEQVDLRLDPDVLGFTRGKPSGRGQLSGWLTLPGDETFDPVSLLLACDALPPATFDLEFTGWVPTLDLTCYIRALPAPGPVRIVQRAQLIQDQRVDQVCHVWDSTGALVAQAVQLCAIRLG